jgi:hypothetical protein
VRLGCQRLENIEVGDRLDGSPEPLVSAPATKSPRAKGERLTAKSPKRRNAARG